MSISTCQGNFDYLCDIKSGNNMNEPFKKVLGHLWLTEDNKPYFITNNAIELTQIQNLRLYVLTNYLKYNSNLLNENQIEIFKGIFEEFKSTLDLKISDVAKNTIIQEVLLKLLVYNFPNLNASFYVVSHIEAFKFNVLFEERLATHIKSDIFNNYENFHNYMHKAIMIYQCTLEVELIKHIENSKNTFWEGTGFEHIANDVFK